MRIVRCFIYALKKKIILSAWIVLKCTAASQYTAAGTNLKRLVKSKDDNYFLQTMTNVVIQKFVQRTLTVLTSTAATTANAGMDIQRMTMVRARVSKLF